MRLLFSTSPPSYGKTPSQDTIRVHGAPHRKVNAFPKRSPRGICISSDPSWSTRKSRLVLDSLNGGVELAIHIYNLLHRHLVPIMPLKQIDIRPKLGIGLLSEPCATFGGHKREAHHNVGTC